MKKILLLLIVLACLISVNHCFANDVNATDTEASIDRPAKELKGFEKVHIKAGEQKTVKFVIDADDLSYFDADNHKWVAESGEFQALIGSSSRDIRSMVKFSLK
jgi:beta-glucosidase